MQPDETHMRPCHVALLDIKDTGVAIDGALVYWGYYRCMNDWCPNYGQEIYFNNEIERL